MSGLLCVTQQICFNWVLSLKIVKNKEKTNLIVKEPQVLLHTFAYICTIRWIFQLNQWGSESLIAALHLWLIIISSTNPQHPTSDRFNGKVQENSALWLLLAVWPGVTTVSQHNIVTNVMPLSRPVTQCHEYQPQITQSLNNHRPPPRNDVF